MIGNDYAAKVLRDCADEFIKQPGRTLYLRSKDRFRARSTKGWAIDEIIFRIKTYDRDPIDIVERFIRQMRLYESYGGLMTEDWKVAKEVGMQALDILNAMD